MNFGVKNNDKTIHFNQVNSIILVIRGVVKMVWQDNYIIINGWRRLNRMNSM